jgi:hypothetical protein
VYSVSGKEKTMTRTSRRAALLIVIGLTATLGVHAQTTGDLIGVAFDEQSRPLSGATVTAESPSLIGGPRFQSTDESGRFAFNGLAVGTYEVHVALDRFAPQNLTNVEVRLKRTTQVQVQLSPATVDEEMTVTSTAPVIDPFKVSQGQVFGEEYLQKAAIGWGGRDYLSVIKQSPGVVDEVLCSNSVDPSVFGSLENENLYLIDGVNSTLPSAMTWGTSLPFDAIKQISLETAGYEAEYGGITGGVISLVTKSGGNRFSGSLDARVDSSDEFENGDHFDRERQPFSHRTFSATLGGPIQQDRLWFFTAIETIDDEFNPYLAGSTWDFEGHSALGKLTWQPAEAWSLVARLTDDPVTIHNYNASPWVRPEATQKWEQGGPTASASVHGVLTNRLTWDLRGSHFENDMSTSPESGDYSAPGHFDCVPIDEWICVMTETAYASGAMNLDHRRSEMQTDLLLLASPKHSIKSGFAYATESKRERHSPLSGYSYYSFFSNTAWLQYVPPGIYPFEFDGDHVGAFLQDSCRIRPRLTAKIGLRWDEATQKNDLSEQVSSFSELQPRLGLAWQITRDGKTLARASWGRFLHPDSLRLGEMARRGLFPPNFIYSPCSNAGMSLEQCQEQHGGTSTVNGYTVEGWIADPEGLDPAGFWLRDWYESQMGGLEIASDLEPMHADQLVVGLEREIAPRTSLELSYVDKAARDIFEDTCVGNYPTPSEEAECDNFIVANLPGLRRDYRGWILRLQSQAKPWLHLIGSYTYSKSQGNVQSTYGASPAFDLYPRHWENRYGYLADDRRHRLRMNGYFLLPWQSTIAFDAAWMSEFPWTPRRFAAWGDYFTEPRGSRRAGKVYWLDLQLSKAVTLGPANVELIGAVNNVLNDEHVIFVCDLVYGCDLDDEHIEMGGPLAFTLPRSYEFGIRLEF